MKGNIGLNVKNYLAEGFFAKGDYQRLADFYLESSRKSLLTADVLMQLSEEPGAKKSLGLAESFEAYLWVITTSYYSMFYAANALFSANGIKIGDKMPHKVSSDVFYFYFVQTGKVAKGLYEAYEDAMGEALDLAAYSEQAHGLAKSLEFERKKRGKFQYNMALGIKKSHAHTSLGRAKEFVNSMEVLIK